MPEQAARTLVEAHSYAGGLRHTPFVKGARRPDWAPPADSVGWRDEFDLTPRDAVVEFSQRAHNGSTVTWIAVYRRSVDAHFGDRNNHAGVGVWLADARVADARALLSSLDVFATALGADPDPLLIADRVAEFASSSRFLHSYLVPAAELPSDWIGAPAAGSALADTTMALVVTPDFEAALPSVAEAVTRRSLAWDSAEITPRTLIRVTSDPAALNESGFASLPAAGTFLADVLERVPIAFADYRKAAAVAEARFAEERRGLQDEIAALKQQWESERRQAEMLDGQPATLESVARQLNLLARQHAGLQSEVRNLAAQRRTEQHEPARASLRVTPRPPVRIYESYQEEPTSWVGWALWGLLVVLLAVAVGLIVYRLAS